MSQIWLQPFDDLVTDEFVQVQKEGQRIDPRAWLVIVKNYLGTKVEVKACVGIERDGELVVHLLAYVEPPVAAADPLIEQRSDFFDLLWGSDMTRRRQIGPAPLRTGLQTI